MLLLYVSIFLKVTLTWFCASAKTAGVYLLRAPEGKYKMNYSQAIAACQADGATLVTFKQLGDAQQVNCLLTAY